jgi:hypothetical protein
MRATPRYTDQSGGDSMSSPKAVVARSTTGSAREALLRSGPMRARVARSICWLHAEVHVGAAPLAVIAILLRATDIPREWFQEFEQRGKNQGCRRP